MDRFACILDIFISGALFSQAVMLIIDSTITKSINKKDFASIMWDLGMMLLCLYVGVTYL